MEKQIIPAEKLMEISRNITQPQEIPKYTFATHNDGTMFLPLHAVRGGDIYRGQHRRYTPCVPNIWRGLQHTHLMRQMSIEDQAKAVLQHAKSLWFCRDIEDHPAIKWARDKKIYVDKFSLAQHYELFTDYLDFSHNFSVAAFFATCCKNYDHWEPVKDGIGVIYLLQPSELWNELPAEMIFETVKPVMLQALPRPEEQSGWVVEVPLGYDLELYPSVNCVEFTQSEKVSKYFLELFDGGKKLFPKDEVSTVANKIKQWTGPIDEAFVDKIIDHWASNDDGIDRPLDVKKAVSLMTGLGNVPNYMLEEDLSQIESMWKEKQEKFNQPCEVYTIDEQGKFERLRVEHK